MPKWLQPNPMVSQRKIRNETTIEISNHLLTRLVLLFGKIDRLTLGTTFPQWVLQYGTMGRISDYVAETYLSLIILQNVQLHIQMT